MVWLVSLALFLFLLDYKMVAKRLENFMEKNASSKRKNID
jgi:hypothetical protein